MLFTIMMPRYLSARYAGRVVRGGSALDAGLWLQRKHLRQKIKLCAVYYPFPGLDLLLASKGSTEQMCLGGSGMDYTCHITSTKSQTWGARPKVVNTKSRRLEYIKDRHYQNHIPETKIQKR